MSFAWKAGFRAARRLLNVCCVVDFCEDVDVESKVGFLGVVGVEGKVSVGDWGDQCSMLSADVDFFCICGVVIV